MLYYLTLKIEAYHKPTDKWHVHSAQQGVRAVSRKHALAKGTAIVRGWPGYLDREGNADWQVEGSATINKEGLSIP